MEMMIIDALYAIGMPHWGASHLQVGAYTLLREPTNPYDPNAIAVYDGPRKVAHLARSNAARLSKILDSDEVNPTTAVYLKPKEKPEVKSRREGPRQMCTIGFKVQKDKASRVRAITIYTR